MKSFKQYQLSESVEQIDEMTQGKEYTQAQLQKKIQSGNWEATHDIKPGKHVEMRHHSGKRVTVHVKEEVDESLSEGKKPQHNLGVGWMLDKDKQLGQKVAQNKARARQERQTMLKYAGKKDVAEASELDEADGKDYHSVHVNGRMWKTFDSKSHADNVAKKIKGATVHKYDAERLQQNYGAKAAARNAARGKQWDE